MRAAGVRHRVHAGRQREEAGKSGTKGEGQVRKVQALGVPRVTISENFASHAAVQELVDVKPD